MAGDLDLLQGTWCVTGLESEGRPMAKEMFAESRITIQGDRFATTGMGAEYAGAISLDESAKPGRIDMKFDAGPPKGSTNLGIYEIDGDTWRICLATHGKVRPKKFDSTAGAGFVVETLVRGKAAAKAKTKGASPAKEPAAAASGPATELEGEWPMVSGVMNGKPMEESLVQWVKRVTRGNLTTVLAGPQVMLKAEFTSDASKAPAEIDYYNLAGANKGKKQHGIYEIADGVLKMCVAAPGDARPAEFVSVPGDGRTLTVWRRG